MGLKDSILVLLTESRKQGQYLYAGRVVLAQMVNQVILVVMAA
jgi:hypothetical protein